MSVASQAPSYIRSIMPYQPGKPISELAREMGIPEASIVKLASNENPLGPSPLAVAAAQAAVTHMHRYADAGGVRLREVLAERLGVTPAHILPGCGSNELILLACQSFLRPGEEAVVHHPTFLMYPIAVRAFGGRVVPVEGRDHGIDLDAMLTALTPRTRSPVNSAFNISAARLAFSRFRPARVRATSVSDKSKRARGKPVLPYPPRIKICFWFIGILGMGSIL